ncbi:MAG: gamma-glutamyl-gamma-aminobutyrate hydrolase family protein [Candidatus Hydrogenedentales bacterium]
MRLNRFLPVLCLLVAGQAFAQPPRIGLVYTKSQVDALRAGESDPLQRYRDALEENEGCVIALLQPRPLAFIDIQLELLDGVLIPGGIDVDPKYYGETPHEKLESADADLDTLEFRVLIYADEHRLPVLGICRGHQLLNVHYGGTLSQDIPSEYETSCPVQHRFPKESEEPRTHWIALKPGSRIEAILGVPAIEVNTYHHQGIKDLAPGLRATASTADGLAEAVEREGSRFVMGVQFHPERQRETDPRLDALFKKLIEEARKPSDRQGR